MSTISVIIVSFNSGSQIGACLGALARQTVAHDVVMVDNASGDNTLRVVAQHAPNARLLPQAENWGFAGGVNQGVAAADSAYIALLNPDARPEPDWLEQLCAPLADPRVGVTGSKVLGDDGRIQSVGTLLQEPVLLPDHRGGGEQDNGQYDAPADVWAVHGAAMAFRRGVWQELGGFDERFFPAYWEECDFCVRARAAGQRVIVVPQAVVRHAEATTTGKYSPEFYFYFHRNRFQYAAKWLPWPALWQDWRAAEQRRLAGAPLDDRRVARLAYEAGIESGVPTAEQRAAVLAAGRDVRAGTLPDDGFAALAAQLDQLAPNSVLEDVPFRSRLPLVARFRNAWNNVATRWYVRPSFDQQTRFNLAALRALDMLAEHAAATAAATALDAALLAWRLHQTDHVEEAHEPA